MGRVMGGRFGKEGTWVYLGLILVDVRQKTTKFCKAIILPLKKFKKQQKKIPPGMCVCVFLCAHLCPCGRYCVCIYLK